MKKLVYGVLMLGWIPTLALVEGVKWTDALLAQGRTPIKVTRIYTGPDGKTKAEEITLPLKPRDGGWWEIPGVSGSTSGRCRRIGGDGVGAGPDGRRIPLLQLERGHRALDSRRLNEILRTRHQRRMP